VAKGDYTKKEQTKQNNKKHHQKSHRQYVYILFVLENNSSYLAQTSTIRSVCFLPLIVERVFLLSEVEISAVEILTEVPLTWMV